MPGYGSVYGWTGYPQYPNTATWGTGLVKNPTEQEVSGLPDGGLSHLVNTNILEATTPPTLVQEVTMVWGGGASPLTKAFTSNVTAGNLLLVFAASNTTSSDPAGATISDTLGHTWTLAGYQASSVSTGSQVYAWFTICQTSGADTISVIRNGGGTWAGVGAHLMEWAHVRNGPLDAVQMVFSDSAVANVCPSFSGLADANDLVLYWAYHGTNINTNTGGIWTDTARDMLTSSGTSYFQLTYAIAGPTVTGPTLIPGTSVVDNIIGVAFKGGPVPVPVPGTVTQKLPPTLNSNGTGGSLTIANSSASWSGNVTATTDTMVVQVAVSPNPTGNIAVPTVTDDDPAGSNTYTLVASSVDNSGTGSGHKCWLGVFTAPIATGGRKPVITVAVPAQTGATANKGGMSAETVFGLQGGLDTSASGTAGGTPTSYVTDTFTGTDGTNLTAHTPTTGTAWVADGAAITILSNQAQVGQFFGPSWYHATPAPSTADYDVQADVVFNGTAGGQMKAGVTARVSGAHLTGYQAYYDANAVAWNLQSWSGGVPTNLGSFSQSYVQGATHTLRLRVQGSTITMFVDGTSVVSVTNTVTSATNNGGLYMEDVANATSELLIDNFSISDIGVYSCSTGTTGATTAAGEFGLAVATDCGNTLTMTAGSATGTIGNAGFTKDPTVSQDGSGTQDLFVAFDASVANGATPGGTVTYSLPIDHATALVSVFRLVGSGGATAYPVAIVATTQVPAPTVQTGRTITPTVISALTVVPVPTVSTPSGATMTPASISCLTVVPVPTVTTPAAGVTLTPVSINCTTKVRPIPDRGITAYVPTKVYISLFHPPDPTFPSQISANGRYFYDLHGNPWLLVGDTAFGLANVLTTTSDVDLYLGTRAAQGFNCVYVNYVYGLYDYNSGSGGASGPYARSDWKTADLIPPFLTADNNTPGTGLSDYDIAFPNPAYVARLDYIVAKAQTLGILIVINPFDSALDQSDNPGFLAGQGTTRCTAYGNWLGDHYSLAPNVAWQWGNDYGLSAQTWPLDTYLGAISLAIRTNAPNQLQAIELNYNVSTGYDNTNWGPGRTYSLDWDSVYDYSVIYDHVSKAYSGLRAGSSTWAVSNTGTATGYAPTPVFFVEGVYERALFDPSTGTVRPVHPALVRMIAYYTICCGGVGGFYGNGVVFPFAGTGPSDTNGWQHAINDLGAVHVGYIGQVFRAGNWHRLVPDGSTPNLVSSQPTSYVASSTTSMVSSTWATGAVTPEGDFGVVYTPTNQALTVNMAKMIHSSSVVARWWDPTNATYTAIGTFSNTGTHVFTPSATNSAGDTDWLLVLTA